MSRTVPSLACAALTLALAACDGGANTPPSGDQAPGPGPAAVDDRMVELELVAGASARLRTPRALAFNPRIPGQLWVVNRADNAVVILHDAPTRPTAEWRRDAMHGHFMPAPSAIAFGGHETTIGRPGTFATIHESDNGGNGFMGPVLWSSDLEVFARMNGPLGSHLDMLHCSPFGMGIAWERDNVYWVFGGGRPEAPGEADITRYDFGRDHGVGEDDHSDNTKHHYVRGQVRRVPGVPSHLAFHAPSRALFIADTGNRRVARLDTASGRPGALHRGPEPSRDDRLIEDAVLTDFVPPGVLARPAGLAIEGGLLYVSDNQTGAIHAFDLGTARPRRVLRTGLPAGALMGIAFGPDGRLYVADALGDRVLRFGL